MCAQILEFVGPIVCTIENLFQMCLRNLLFLSRTSMKNFIQYGAKIRMDGPALGRERESSRIGELRNWIWILSHIINCNQNQNLGMTGLVKPSTSKLFYFSRQDVLILGCIRSFFCPTQAPVRLLCFFLVLCCIQYYSLSVRS